MARIAALWPPCVKFGTKVSAAGFAAPDRYNQDVGKVYARLGAQQQQACQQEAG